MAVTTGSIGSVGGDSDMIILCDDNGSFLRHIVYDTDGSVKHTFDTNLNGTTAYTPVGTIETCAASTSDMETLVLCDNNGSFLRHLTRDADGTVTISDTTLNGTTAYIPVGTVKYCGGETLTTETYRIAGPAVGASTPSTGPASNPTVGNTVAISPPYRALSWVWLRQTQQDPGDGTVAKLTVNGFEYNAGNGPVYATAGGQITADNGQTFLTPYVLTAAGQAYVEITVIR